MIITLAGHVDHGKTTLVRALTGVNTDRLAEEKRRGLTIDLGFAYRAIDDEVLGFVDVPGHHRFIHNMIAGVAQDQIALLVVAADDGPMPQTREHLQILSLIGVERGVIALSKCDRVDEARIATARDEIAELVGGSFLADAQVVETALDDDPAITALLNALLSLRRTSERVAHNPGFRLAIDRAFNVRGAGTVVTGTVHSGSLSLGDEVLISPTKKTARARGLRAQDHESKSIQSGDRAAINLAGIDLADVQRGQWLVNPRLHNPTRNVTLALTVLADFPRSVKHWLPVHAYLGTSHRQGKIALTTPEKLAPGTKGLVDLVLDDELDARFDDQLILRDHGLDRTIGGGRVVWSDAPGRKRRLASRLNRLTTSANSAVDGMAAALLADEAIDADSLQRFLNLTEHTLPTDTRKLGDGRVVNEALWSALLAQILGFIAATSDGTSRNHCAPEQADRTLVNEAISTLIREGLVSDDNGLLSPANRQIQLDPFARSLLDRMKPHLQGATALSLGDIASRLKMTSRELSDAIAPMEKAKALIRVSKTRAYLPETLKDCEQTARTLAANGGAFTVRQFCDETGLGRNAGIEMLEYLDRTGVTMRRENTRILRPG
ncbi:MAG: selenocysteine-specific translation elongation factor [Pseudomonadaceae bacterium]|nr:selenocysteine-specific translation elongation factor [Pseudomonadaceae bacterium]